MRRSYRPRNRSNVTFRYKPQYGVIIVCKDEPHQRALHNRLSLRGFNCKAVMI